MQQFFYFLCRATKYLKVITFKEYLLNEVAVSKRNVAELIRLYGVKDEQEATDIIDRWNKAEPYMNLAKAKEYIQQELGPEYDIYLPPNANSKDIFVHARAKEHRANGKAACIQNQQYHNKPCTGKTEEWYGKAFARDQLDAVLRGSESEMLQRKEAKAATAENKAKVQKDTFFLETDCGTVYKPNTHEESRDLSNYGNSCAWCTSSEEPNIFKDYINKGITLFYFIPKDTPCGKEVPRGNRNSGFYALALYPVGTRNTARMEGFDEDDQHIGAPEIFDMFKLSEEQQTMILKYAPDYSTLEKLFS